MRHHHKIPDQDPAATEQITEWFVGRLPDEWFTEVQVLVDKDEILVLGTLPDEEGDAGPAALEERIVAFREASRDDRVAIAAKAESLFGRKVTWGVRAGETRVLFTHLTVPVMTRLRIDERHLLDTLVAAGVARSRSDALGWCVRLVAQHEGDWLGELREALSAVEEVRKRQPGA